jgi:glycosyltransferase A (GT-A) superfamily protein (DUF2064 family)
MRNSDRSETRRPPSPGEVTVARAQAGECCIVLMMKSAVSSKRRLAAAIGDERATHAAQHLIGCAREDLEAWPGNVCIAPADAGEIEALGPTSAAILIAQRGDNLGERINHVNAALVERGVERQIYVGIDCPMLDLGYFERAAAALTECDVVFGPALDGGVVLMGVNGRWPDLSRLPWSTGELFGALESACAAAGARAAVLEPMRDVDTLDDLLALRAALAGDSRPSRRALTRWLARQQDLQGK